MIHDRIKPRDGERIDSDTCPDCFHAKDECVPECSSAHTEPNTQEGQTTLLSRGMSQIDGMRLAASTPSQQSTGDQLMTGLTHCRNADGDEAGIRTMRRSSARLAQNSFDDRIADTCEWFDSLPKPPKPLPWVPQEKATDRHPFA